MQAASKIFIGLVFFLTFLIFLPGSTHAQTGTTLGQPLTISSYKAPQNTDYGFLNTEHAVMCEGIGTSTFPSYGSTNSPTQACLAYGPNGMVQAYNITPSGGAVGGLGKIAMGMMTTPPATVGEYVAYVGSNLGLVPKAYAQVGGSGSGVIQPVFLLWQGIRNVSYLGFILVFIVVGFMIMFRQRLNPQTVITVQSALPGLAIGIALVTFSYFIAALLIDISFVLVQLVGSLFAQVQNNALGNGNQLIGIAQNDNIFGLFTEFVRNGNTLTTVTDPIMQAFRAFSGGGISPTAFLPGGLGGSIGVLSSGLVLVILVIAVIIQLIRLVWQLLQAYISIFVNTILGPIFILYSTLPGRRGALTFWWKNILGNALIFPAVFAAFLFAGLLVNQPVSAFSNSLPLFAFPQGFLRAILAFGIVLATPAIPKAVKGAIGVKDFGEFAAAAIAGYGAGAAVTRGAGNFAYSGAMERLGIPARRKALQEMSVKSAENSSAYRSGSLRDFWAKHGPGK